MSQTKITGHTPGPWEWTLPNPSAPAEQPSELLGAPRPGGKPLAGVTIRTLVNGLGQYLDGERDANARLIASAPDLLEACRLLVQAWEERHGAPGMSNSAYMEARAAIAKAEGKEGR